VVLGNDAQVRQIVGNLVTNGLEAIGDEEGEISLAIGVADASEIGMTASAWSNWVPGAERMGNLDRA
jgi:signal transduction histidine kinase